MIKKLVQGNLDGECGCSMGDGKVCGLKNCIFCRFADDPLCIESYAAKQSNPRQT